MLSALGGAAGEAPHELFLQGQEEEPGHTYWDSNKTLPVSLTFDLGATKRIQYLGVGTCA